MSIQLSRSERASLKKIADRARQPSEIPAVDREMLLGHRLIRNEVLLLSVTSLGQIELLRQRFGTVKPQPPIRQAVFPAFRRVPLLSSRLAESS